MSTGQVATVKACPGLEDLRVDRRISRPKGVTFAGYPIRRVNEKAKVGNHAYRKRKIRLVTLGQKALCQKEDRAGNFFLIVFVMLFVVGSTGMVPIGMTGASLFPMKDRIMQGRTNAGKRKQGNQAGQGQGQHLGDEFHAYSMTYRKMIAIRKSRPTNRGR